MSIYASAVKQPITTLMIFVGVLVFGVFSLIQLPIDLFPEMDPPYISVLTTYSGANASDIEENITKLLEDQLNSIDNLKEITSTSSENLSVVNLEFEWETNLDEASNDVRSVIDLLSDALPEESDEPQLFKFNTSMFPILFYSATAEESYEGLEKIIDEKVINQLNRINGIGSVSMVGTPIRVVYVDIDPIKLEAYDLTIEEIGNIIQTENLNTPAGNVRMGSMEYQLRVEGEFDDSEQVGNIVIGYQNGQSIRLKEIATVKDREKDYPLVQKIDGSEGGLIFVMKQSGANTVKIAQEVRKEMVEIEKTLPPDIKITVLNDSSEFISDSISNLSKTLMYALLFVVLVVLVFLGRWRATIIVALTIPISLIVAFIYLYVTEQTINVIALSSLSIAIGMVVDDAIVVLENITHHIERGSTPREASIYATNEVWLSVIVTTMVVVAVFFPLTLLSGMTGILFRQLGWIVTITTITSTLIAISLTPMLTSKLLKNSSEDKPHKSRKLYERTIGRALGKLDDVYESTIKWALSHKAITAGIAVVIFVFSLFLFGVIQTDFIPESDENSMTAYIELESALRVEETAKVAEKVNEMVKEEFPEVLMTSLSYGSDDAGGLTSLFSSTGSNIINLRMKLTKAEERTNDVWTLADRLRQKLDGLPEVINYSVSTSSNGSLGENNIDVEIYGYDFDVTNNLSHEIANLLKEVDGATDIQISRDKDKPELTVRLDQEKLSEAGLNTAMVSTALRNRVYGLTASRYKENGEEYDIIVRLEQNKRSSITDLENITIKNPMGVDIKIKEIGRIEENWSPPNIEHKRKERLVTVSVTPQKGVALGDLADRVKSKIADVEIPPEVIINVGGSYEDQQESFMDLASLLALSLVLVYLVMASQFESFKMPFIIMFSIPFAFSGVAFALYFTHTTLSVVALLGAVLLVGIVVKNGIVLVDFINLMRERGHKLYEAITIACKSRLRPVLMTAFTTIFGMLPMALSTGEGSEIWKPMGISVIGGLFFSTIVTMVIVPVVYALFTRSGERDRIKEIRAKFSFMDEQ